jgi:hypothetical protein
MPKLTGAVRGSLVTMKRVCGKPNCHCRKGFKHKALYLSQRYKGRTRMVYVPQDMEEKAAEYTKNYREIKQILDKISDINIELLRKRKLIR